MSINIISEDDERMMTQSIVSNLKKRWDKAIYYLLLNNHPLNNEKSDGNGNDDIVTDGATIPNVDTSLPPKTMINNNRWFHKIIQLQQSSNSDPVRQYHTVRHIEEMFGYMDLAQQSTSLSWSQSKNEVNESIVTLAIFFHDAVYNPKSSTNEEDSVALFREMVSEIMGAMDAPLSSQFVQKAVDVSSVERVVRYIMATKRHSLVTPDGKQYEDDEDCRWWLKLFLDCDMSVLAKDAAAYDAYAGLIRQEYAFVDKDVYCEKRAEILEGFLRQEEIFYGDDIKRAGLEKIARVNLEREIEMLKSGHIPGH